MNARDELVTDIMQHPWLVKGEFTGDCPSCPDLTIKGGYNSPSHAGHLADAILAAGWVKPRTITTAEELDALKLPAIIDSPSGGPAKVEYYAGPGRQKYVEPLFGGDDDGDDIYSLKLFAAFGLPATVLHEGQA